MAAERTDDLPLIVIGSGAAGLSAALAAAEAGVSVRVLSSGPLLSGSSPRAQGGVAAAIGADDSVALHLRDTLAVGAGLNDRGAVEALVRDGRDAVLGLLARHVPFDGEGRPTLGLEAGHSRRRILHANGSATGLALSTALLGLVAAHPRINISPDTPADGLMVECGRVTGVRTGTRELYGRAVILATGGYAGLWGRTTNPPENRGSGISLAWEAGASIADLEFVQFHPTALNLPNEPAFLLSEALRGDGALVVDEQHRTICDSLLPRDVLARTIFRHLRDRGPVYLSLRHLDAGPVRTHFPNIATQLAGHGLDITTDPIPIAPAAHYCMGGVRTDIEGRTSLPGLYGAGEVACTGVQGANRLASNSLLECLVFGARAAHAAALDGSGAHASWNLRSLRCDAEPINAATSTPMPLGDLLDRDLGVERDAVGLRHALAVLPNPAQSEVSADAWLAGRVVRAALLRRESRGAHYRTDAPETEARWCGRIHWRRGYPPALEEVSAS